jgi:hypothetical protein
MEISSTLFQLTADMAAIEDALWENGGELTPELEEAMTETSASLMAKTDSYGALIRKFDSAASAIDAEIKRLQALKKTAANAVERLKGRILFSMQANGVDKLDGTYTKFSLRRSEKTITDDESMLAPYLFALEEFRKALPAYIQLGDFKINKTAIKDMVKKDGVLPSGATIEDNWSVIMK